MTIEELNRHIRIGKLPVVIYCDKRYEGICCMLKITENNELFLDYDDTYDDADSEGGFRATFIFDSFEIMVQAVEDFTNMKLDDLTINPYCYDKFECEEPQWTEFQWDLYNGKIQMLKKYSEFFIGSFWWNGLFQKKITPDCNQEEYNAWIDQSTDNFSKGVS